MQLINEFIKFLVNFVSVSCFVVAGLCLLVLLGVVATSIAIESIEISKERKN